MYFLLKNITLQNNLKNYLTKNVSSNIYIQHIIINYIIIIINELFHQTIENILYKK